MSSVQLGEPVRPVRDEKMPRRVVKRAERRPPRRRLLGRDPADERGRHVPPRGQLVEERAETWHESPVTHEVEAGDAPRLGTLAREGGETAGNRLLAEGQDRPGHRRPRRRNQGGLGRARRGPVDEHLRDRHLVGELVLAERQDVGLSSQDAQRHQALAHRRRGPHHGRVLGAPGEAERVEEVRGLELRVVVEARSEHPVDHARAGPPPGPDLPENAGARAQGEGVLGYLQGRCSELDRGDGHSVRNPAGAVGGREEGRVAQREPEEPAGRIGEAGHGVPGGRGTVRHADRQPAVPREVLELDRSREDRGAEARLRVVRGVLDAARVVDVHRLGSDRVTGDGALAPRAQRRDQLALERQLLRLRGDLAGREPLVEGVGPPPGRRIAGALAEDQVGVAPAHLERRRAGAPVRSHGGLRPQRRHLHRLDRGVPVGAGGAEGRRDERGGAGISRDGRAAADRPRRRGRSRSPPWRGRRAGGSPDDRASPDTDGAGSRGRRPELRPRRARRRTGAPRRPGGAPTDSARRPRTRRAILLVRRWRAQGCRRRDPRPGRRGATRRRTSPGLLPGRGR